MRIWSILLILTAIALPVQAGFPVCTAKQDQTFPAIAYDSTNFLVTWTDTRDFLTDSSTNIYACRVTPAGQVLDTANILVVGGRRDQMVPRIAMGQDDWFLIWQEGC